MAPNPEESSRNLEMHQEDEYIVRSKLPSIEYPNITFGEYMAGRITAHDPSLIAFFDQHKSFRPVTYGELHQNILECASGLVSLGITADSSVAYFSDNSMQHTISWFGGLYLGSPLLLQVSPFDGPFDVHTQLEDNQTRILIVGVGKLKVLQRMLDNEEYRRSLSKLELIILLNSNPKEENVLRELVKKNFGSDRSVRTFEQVTTLGVAAEKFKVPYFPVEDPKNRHLGVYYTSGTSGKSKGAVHTHGSFVSTMINWKFPENHWGKRLLTCQPLGHLSGSHFMPMAIDAGMSVLMLVIEELTMDQIMQAIEQYRVNFYIFTGHASPLLNKDYEKLYDLSSLEGIRHGGTKFDHEMLRKIRQKYGTRMYETYASTEMASHVSITDQSQTLENWQPGNLGNLLNNVEMKILDLNTGKSLAEYQNGEICFRGPPCFVGYLNNEFDTRQTLDSDGWYHTGDVGHYDAFGRLFITDRIKEMICWHQSDTAYYHMFPGEVEQYLSRHPKVAAVCVVGVPHSTHGNLARAYVQPKEGEQMSEQEVAHFVNDNLCLDEWLHGGVRIIAEMPRTVIGKVDRKYFKNLVKDELLTEPIQLASFE